MSVNSTEHLREPLEALFHALERQGQERGILRSATFEPPGARFSDAHNYPDQINLVFARANQEYEIRLVLNPGEVRVLEFARSEEKSEVLAIVGVGSPDRFVVMRSDHDSADRAAEQILDRAEELLDRSE